MHQQHTEAGPKLASVALPHRFKLLRDICGIDFREFALAKESHLLLRPREEILLIGYRIAGHRSLHGAVISLYNTSYWTSRTVARALWPAASMTVSWAKPTPAGCQLNARLGVVGGRGRPSTS